MSRFELYCTILILFLTFMMIVYLLTVLIGTRIKKRGAKHERKRM